LTGDLAGIIHFPAPGTERCPISPGLLAQPELPKKINQAQGVLSPLPLKLISSIFKARGQQIFFGHESIDYA
jgi:hypothetical protein